MDFIWEREARRKGPWLPSEYNVLMPFLPHTSESQLCALPPPYPLKLLEDKKGRPSLAQKRSTCKAVFSSEVLIDQKQVCLVVSCTWLAHTGHPFLKLKILLFNHVKIMCLDTLEEKGLLITILKS